VLKVATDDLKPRMAAAAKSARDGAAQSDRNMRGVLEDTERKQILSALEHTNWIVAGPNGAAARLGMKRSTLQSRMQKLGVRISRTDR
jgi:formate hydrogenlyase transcriptional activator